MPKKGRAEGDPRQYKLDFFVNDRPLPRLKTQFEIDLENIVNMVRSDPRVISEAEKLGITVDELFKRIDESKVK